MSAKAYAICYPQDLPCTIRLQSVDSPFVDIIVDDDDADDWNVTIYTTIHGIIAHNEFYASRFAVCMYSDLMANDDYTITP